MVKHESDLLIHTAAKKTFDEMGYGKNMKAPTVAMLRNEYAEVLAEKKKVYAGYKQARADMGELQNVKANVEYLLDIPASRQTQQKDTRPRV